MRIHSLWWSQNAWLVKKAMPLLPYIISLLETAAICLMLLWCACRCLKLPIPIVSSAAANQYICYNSMQEAEQETGCGEPAELVLRGVQSVQAMEGDNENDNRRFMQLPVMETSHGATSELVL